MTTDGERGLVGSIVNTHLGSMARADIHVDRDNVLP